MNEYSTQEEIDRGREAGRIINSDLWKEAIEGIDRSLLDKMIEHHGDAKACQEIAMTKVVVDNFVSWFKEIEETGQMAEYQLNQEAEIEKRKQRLRAIPGA